MRDSRAEVRRGDLSATIMRDVALAWIRDRMPIIMRGAWVAPRSDGENDEDPAEIRTPRDGYVNSTPITWGQVIESDGWDVTVDGENMVYDATVAGIPGADPADYPYKLDDYSFRSVMRRDLFLRMCEDEAHRWA